MRFLKQGFFILLVDRIFPFRRIEMVDAGGVGLLHFAADDLHRAVDHAVLLGERFRQDGEGGRQPTVGEEGGQVASLAETVYLRLDDPDRFLASFV